MPPSLYWYDYETFGADPVRDRPAQFAGQRTDEALNPIGDPQLLYCRPANDFLPQPMACLITGITPQLAGEKGMCEAGFIDRIRQAFLQPHTTLCGYNNVRFDDEMTRHTLYRNLFDPYEHEWRHGNSRWDLIDVMRLTYALRPQGLRWPKRDDGAPSFRLEDLTRANDIPHQGAHDAMADVQATIELARLLKSAQPRLYAYCFDHRRKRDIQLLIDLDEPRPLLHVSEKYPATRGCLAVVTPVGLDPGNPNAVIVVDLNTNPEPLLTLDPDSLRERLFTPGAKLPSNVERPGLKTIRVNRCPVVAPFSALQPDDADRLGIDLDTCRKNLDIILQNLAHLKTILPQVYAHQDTETIDDPDLLLYRGGFFGEDDRRRMESLHRLSPEQLATANIKFDDPRLPEMLFRYRARNWPETLTAEELKRWEQFRLRRLTCSDAGASITLDEFRAELKRLGSETIQSKMPILQSLETYAREIVPSEGHCLPEKSLS